MHIFYRPIWQRDQQLLLNIEAIYELTVSNGKLQIVKQSANFNFGGNTSFSGSTTIDSEVANADVSMNVDGDLALNLGFKTNNISNLNINATGDVYIDCGSQNCGSATINVTTRGKVTLVNGNKFGEIKALGTVTLRIGAKAKNIRSASPVTLESGSQAEQCLYQYFFSGRKHYSHCFFTAYLLSL